MKALLADPKVPLSLARLRAISAVCELGSYSAAGRFLGVSHAAVSQQIRDLEAAHGIRLFDRVQGIMVPTPVCLELAAISQRVSSAEQDAARILKRRDSQGKPRLRIGLGNATPGIAIAAALLAQHPQVTITILTGSHQDVMAMLLRRQIEVAVLPDVPAEPRFRRFTVLTQEVVAIVATDGPWAGRQSVTLAELAEKPLVFRSRGSSTQKVVDRAFRRQGLVPEPCLTADTRDAVYEAVTMGIGTGFMWRHGTRRTDTVRRLKLPQIGPPTEEVVFALADERNDMVEAFFAAAEHFARSTQMTDR